MDDNSQKKTQCFVFANTMAARQHVTLAPLLLACLLLLLSGCLSMKGGGENLEGRIDRWVNEKEYEKALAEIDAVDVSDARYKNVQLKRREVLVLVKKYEQELVKSGMEDMRRNDWGAVLDRYDAAFKKLPASARLRTEYNNIVIKQKIIIHKAEQKVLFAKGEMLEKEITYNQELSQVDPRNLSIKKILEIKSKEARNTSLELLIFAEAALDKGDLKRAKNISGLAYRLDPSKKSAELKAKVSASIKSRAERKRAVAKNAQRKKTKKAKQRAYTLMSKLNGLMSDKNYMGATQVLKTLKTNAWKHPELAEKEASFHLELLDHVDHQIKLGYGFYKRENYKRALDIWEGVLGLQPNHKQAKEYVERVKKVIKKLAVLQSKSAA
ncbi:MAG: hypothetical protein JKY01_03125 [Pseudomonadales bacterium]|nr:hypothetical protein [Pseudomonadales bacterium]